VVSIFFLSSIFFPHLISAAADWTSTILPHMLWPSANLECRSEMCCTWLAGNTGHKKIAIAQLCRAISSELRHVSTVGKNLLNSKTSSTCPDNMVNFGLLTAGICWRVWGSPANFERVSHLSSVTARHCSSGRQPNFATLNRGRHLHSAGRPSRWALAHILVVVRIIACTSH